MIKVNVGRNKNGITMELPSGERQRWPDGRSRIFIATEPHQEGLRLGQILNETQAYAAAGILTGTGGRKESLLFVDPVTGENLLSIDLLRPG